MLRLICVFSIIVRLSRHSTDDLPLIMNLSCHNIMLIVATLSFELVSSMSIAIVDLWNNCRDINKFISTQ